MRLTQLVFHLCVDPRAGRLERLYPDLSGLLDLFSETFEDKVKLVRQRTIKSEKASNCDSPIFHHRI